VILVRQRNDVFAFFFGVLVEPDRSGCRLLVPLILLLGEVLGV
jgi:hypothetical protein